MATPEPMLFHGLQLDRFQIEAIQHLNNGSSVVVSAATGTGKTVIADYIIDKSFREGKKVFYTAPIKALSNQKYAEFKESYGPTNVGILTGDVVHNPTAPLVIMTTEIYRNMLLAKDRIIGDLAAVVFDEIHYLGDVDRGTVWEECIIFSPPNIRFVCLSATIPNARQFANWIQSIKGHPVEVITEKKRAVPLEHQFFDMYYGLSSLQDMRARKRQGHYQRYRQRKGKTRVREAQRDVQRMDHRNLISVLKSKGMLSCIYFCFSRANTERHANDLSQRQSFLTPEQQRQVTRFVEEKLVQTDPSVARLETTKLLVRCLQKGIAFHHAGLLPILKEMVEQSFAKGFLSVLYATETFAVGINLPARTVCFDSLEKYDGTNFRYVTGKEYFQLAGRAGRRGLDTVGYAISMVDPEFADFQLMQNLVTGDKDSLQSQYKLSYNTILNLISNHTSEEREVILRSSFFTYQVAGQHKERIFSSYQNKVKKLIGLGYLEEDANTLTLQGEFARRIYVHEIVLTELFMSSLAHEFCELEIILICASLEYEEKRAVTFKKGAVVQTHSLLAKFKQYREIYSFFKESNMEKLEPMLSLWYSGGSFSSLLDITTLPEGDIVRFMRRIIDVLQQVLHAINQTMPSEIELRDKLFSCIAKIDRGIVRVKV